MGKIIKNLHEFDLNEGIVQSIFGGIGDLFTSKKSKLTSILKQIKAAKNEELEKRVELEKKVGQLTKENLPEFKFELANLNKQLRTYSSIKNLEINNLSKKAEEIIDNDAKLLAFYSAELAKIEADTTNKLIKQIALHRDKSYLDQLNAEFDRLTKDANKKERFYQDYEDQEDDEESFKLKASTSLLDFLEMNTYDAKKYVKDLDTKELYKLNSEIKELSFEMDYNFDKKLSALKSETRKAKKEGQDYLLPTLEQEEMMIRFKHKKLMDSFRIKSNLIDKELKYKKYGNY